MLDRLQLRAFKGTLRGHMPWNKGDIRMPYYMLLDEEDIQDHSDNFRAQAALFAVKYSGTQITVAKDFMFRETNKILDLRNKFLPGKVLAF